MAHGPIALFGSGETSKAGRKVHEQLFRAIGSPIRLAIVEAPAGFQPNVSVVSEKLRAFFATSLRNFNPEIRVVAARRRGGVYDPDAPEIVEPLEQANYIFAGPGSPTYAVRTLQGTRTLDLMCRQNAEGAALVLASAAAIASGRFALPVYEIYKVGADLHWMPGLNIFASFGLDLTVLPHWNNTEGGSELDTSHCFVGAERFRYLRRLLPRETTLLMIDEHTACILYPDQECGEVSGSGQVRIARCDQEVVLSSGDRFSLGLLSGA
jgi:hypothetical protein